MKEAEFTFYGYKMLVSRDENGKLEYKYYHPYQGFVTGVERLSPIAIVYFNDIKEAIEKIEELKV
jgi:hypothetical protein